MNNLPSFLILVFITSGCSSAQKDPYAQAFDTYTGEQQVWRTEAGAFANNVDGIPIYYGFPSRPYELLGRVVTHTFDERRIAKCVRIHGGNAACVVRSDSVNAGTTYNHGFTWYGNGWSWTSPGSAQLNTFLVRTVAIIKFKPDIFDRIVTTNKTQ